MTTAKDTSHINWADWFYYDETSESGLRWACDIINCFGKLTRTRKGQVAGNLDAHGYYRVQLNRSAYKVHRIIYELLTGKRIAIDEEVDHIDQVRSNNAFSNLEPTLKNCRNKKMTSCNKSGVTGVNRTSRMNKSGEQRHYWRATWMTLDGKGKNKCFAVLLYGEERAFSMACEYRNKVIDELNRQGAMYRQHHGKDKAG